MTDANADLYCKSSICQLTRMCTWHNACLRMYGTLCFLALISNSMVFIYPGQFLPAFGRSQQILDYYPNGLVSTCIWSKHGKDDRPLLRASRFTTPQYMHIRTWHNTHTRFTPCTHRSGLFNKATSKLDRAHACAPEGSLVLICSQSSIGKHL